MPNKSELIIYQTPDGETKLDVHIEGDTVWLTQADMVQLFQSSKANISEHIKRVFEEGELEEGSTVRNFRTVQNEGTRQITREITHYNLDVIISVGYRVKSQRGTQFRIWATKRLNEYIVKGFTMNDELLKQAGGGNYFDELLARIRDIRSSEKVFWRKILDIYATSIDYDPRTEVTKEFFATVQNKLHFAVHGYTAAEIIQQRANSSLPNMGLTNWPGKHFSAKDVSIAKNYLNQEELGLLNRMVTAYLEIAEIQAAMRRPMYMKDWKNNLDDVLRTTGRNILDNPGKVSHEVALEKARQEYEIYRREHLDDLSPVELHFFQSIEKKVAKLEKSATI